MIEAMYYVKEEDKTTYCILCPVGCRIPNGKTGLCRARENNDGVLFAKNFGQTSALALDPIEKKPLYHFYAGKKILSVGSYGCNFRCGFCQNYEISMENPRTEFIPPEELVEKAEKLTFYDNIGIAFTYNEPLIGYEYVLECAKLAKDKGLKTVLVTNGFIKREPLLNLLPFIHAMNIDLKAFSDDFYKSIGGERSAVMKTIELAAGKCHVEITTLVIPGKNDSDEEMEELAKWLSSISPEIPLHINRFFPRYKMQEENETPKETILRLKTVAQKYLKYVYAGNIR